MKLETFFEKFELFADAPDAVAHLRDIVYSVELVAEKWPHESLESVALKVTDGTHQTPRYVETGIPFVSVKDFSGGSLDMSATRFITPEEHSEIYKRCDPKRGDILLGRIGTIGKAVVVDTDTEFSLFVSAAQIRPNREKILSRYLQYVLNSPFCRAQFDNIKVGGATHTNKLNLKDLRSVKVPLPPLAEQKRIVAKVDELMALCDRLEAQQQERETRHTALVRASLARFTEAPTPANLQFLFHPSYDVTPADLRKTILSLAVQGKLVPQDPNDEPAEGMSEIEAPFDVPASWQWKRLGALGLCRTGKTPPTSDPSNYGFGFPFIGPGQITSDGRITAPEKIITSKGLENCTEADVSDILMVCIGGSIGKAAICRERLGFNQQINSVRLYHDLPEFIYLAVTSEYFQEQVLANASGSATPIINKGKWERIPVPVPPLAEQRRIVAKVEQLMALVDELEQQLAASRATAEKLLTALVAELTNGK